jgi:hypothetical protein
MRMRSAPQRHLAGGARCAWRAPVAACVSMMLLFGACFHSARARAAQNRANPLTSWTVTIVLPPKLMAGHPATLAVLGVDGRLAPGVRVELSDDQTVTTDSTGRALFNAPPKGDYLLAKGSGASAAVLIDPAAAESEPKAAALPPIVSARDRFWVCGPGLSGRADQDSITINGQPAATLAASPVCLVALAAPTAKPGPATVSVEAPGVAWNAMTTLISLEFEAPGPSLKPGQKGQLVIQARGSDEKIGILAQNQTPEVLRFLRGDRQELVTSGGSENSATLAVQAISSGDFSFSARLLPAPDQASAERYLRAAAALAPKDFERRTSELARRLAQHPGDAASVRSEVERLATSTLAGDFRTLLEAAQAAL